MLVSIITVNKERQTGFVKPTNGISVHLYPNKVRHFGGAYKIIDLPDTFYLKLTFQYGWSEKDDEETPMKGYRSDGIVETSEGKYPVYFIDPIRLQQDLTIEVKNLDHLGLVAGIIDELGI